jgi:phosphohistidine phosphatase SixA
MHRRRRIRELLQRDGVVGLGFTPDQGIGQTPSGQARPGRSGIARDSKGAKPRHTGQANARTGPIVYRVVTGQDGKPEMQLLLIRHALPLRSEPGQGSDPHLSPEGLEQAQRLPEALKRFPITRLVSSPQIRAVETAQPVAAALDLPVEVDDRLAEYDRDMAHYIPIEQIAAEFPEELERLAGGHLPSTVDEAAFLARITAGIADLIQAGEHEDTVG